ncbi:MAG: hypothetical protein ABSA22_06080 [Acidimicrobiales bacterium]|jgi:hypothetical protein
MPISGPFGWGRQNSGPKVLSPEQQKARAALGQDEVVDIDAKQDARYDAMTEEERDKYYVHPNLFTKIKKAWRGE